MSFYSFAAESGAVCESRARDFHVITGLNRGKHGENSRSESKNFAEVIGGKDDKSQLPTGEILLITKVLIRGNHHLIILLRRGNQVAIAEPVPLPLASGGDFMAGPPSPQSPRNAMIEEYLHAASEKLVRRAYSRTATTCSRVTPSNASRYSSRLTPPSRFSNKLLTGSRVPAKHSAPLMRSGFCHTGRPGIG